MAQGICGTRGFENSVVSAFADVQAYMICLGLGEWTRECLSSSISYDF